MVVAGLAHSHNTSTRAQLRAHLTIAGFGMMVAMKCINKMEINATHTIRERPASASLNEIFTIPQFNTSFSPFLGCGPNSFFIWFLRAQQMEIWYLVTTHTATASPWNVFQIVWFVCVSQMSSSPPKFKHSLNHHFPPPIFGFLLFCIRLWFIVNDSHICDSSIAPISTVTSLGLFFIFFPTVFQWVRDYDGHPSRISIHLSIFNHHHIFISILRIQIKAQEWV